MEVNLPLLKVLKISLAYMRYLKDILSRKRKLDMEICKAMSDQNLSPKLKDLGGFSIPCTNAYETFNETLCNLGASVNIMSFSTFYTLGIRVVKPTKTVK